MKETEITVQVFNRLEEIDNILKNQGYKMIENYQLNDWYFTHIDDVKNVSYQDLLNNSVLVREMVSENRKIQLLYKKKELDKEGNVISEEKTKVVLSDLNNAINIFTMAGFNNYAVVKNNSWVYENKQERVAFVVQVVEDLGIFIEYEEDDTMNGMTETEKFEHMSNVIKGLGLQFGEDYSCKKVYMILNKNNI